MEITLLKEVILPAIDKVLLVTRTKTSLPITACAEIWIHGAGGRVSATDLEISTVAQFEHPGGDYGTKGDPVRFCCNAQVLRNLLASFPMNAFTIIPPEAGAGSLVIKSGGIEASIACIDPEEFPVFVFIGEDGTEFDALGAKLLAAWKKVVYAVSKDETRWALTGVMMRVVDGTLTVCATDGFRLSLWEDRSLDIGKDVTTPMAIVPLRAVHILQAVMPEGANVTVSATVERIRFSWQGCTVQTRLISGAYPDYDQAIPSEGQTVSINREAFLAAIKRAQLMAVNNEPARVSTWSAGVSVEVTSASGQIKETLEAALRGDGFSVLVNTRFMVDVLARLGGAETIMLVPPVGSGPILIAEEEQYRNIVMPIRE
jgi:DNA polymerase-3 subunit beta